MTGLAKVEEARQIIRFTSTAYFMMKNFDNLYLQHSTKTNPSRAVAMHINSTLHDKQHPAR